MEAKSDMVSFRAGALNERLRAGPLTAGGKTKRDLIRYYTLLDTGFEGWWKDQGISDDAWDVVVAFVNTRYWDTLPDLMGFFQQFLSFLQSPMAESFAKEERAAARLAVAQADLLQMAAIIDRAEVSSQAEQADATAGATLAAS
jgi:hypothetical protein